MTSLPRNKILCSTKFKAFPGDKFSVPQKMISVFDEEGNIVEKGRKFWILEFFSFFQNVFKSFFVFFLFGTISSGSCGTKLIPVHIWYCHHSFLRHFPPLVTTRPISYLHQTSSALRR